MIKPMTIFRQERKGRLLICARNESGSVFWQILINGYVMNQNHGYDDAGSALSDLFAAHGQLVRHDIKKKMEG